MEETKARTRKTSVVQNDTGSITFGIVGIEETIEFDPYKADRPIKNKLMNQGAIVKITRSASALQGQAALDAMKRTVESLEKGDWTSPVTSTRVSEKEGIIKALAAVPANIRKQVAKTLIGSGADITMEELSDAGLFA